MTPSEIEDLARPQLLDDEKLLWTGAPKQGLIFQSTDLATVPFSLMWCGFAVFWEMTVLRMGAPLIMKLWGIPFVCVGLYLLGGRFFFDAWKRKSTSYALTNKRLLFLQGEFNPTVRSISLDPSNIQMQTHPDGTGTLAFGVQIPAQALLVASSLPGMKAGKNIFLRIESPEKVFQLATARES